MRERIAAAPPDAPEYFGDDAQKALLAGGCAMRALTRDDPRFAYYGRTVGLADASRGGMEDLAALQGNSNVAALPNADVANWRAQAQARRLVPVTYARWSGGATAREAAQAMLAAHVLPDDLSLRRIDADAPRADLARLADVALVRGVLPPAGRALRGIEAPGVALVAVDSAGRGVSCATAAGVAHPDHPLGGQCWWGMLAKLPNRRGQRVTLILGTMALLEALDRLGFDDAFTGVEPGNAASDAVCARLGLSPETHSVLGVADPSLLPSGRMTK